MTSGRQGAAARQAVQIRLPMLIVTITAKIVSVIAQPRLTLASAAGEDTAHSSRARTTSSRGRGTCRPYTTSSALARASNSSRCSSWEACPLVSESRRGGAVGPAEPNQAARKRSLQGAFEVAALLGLGGLSLEHCGIHGIAAALAALGGDPLPLTAGGDPDRGRCGNRHHERSEQGPDDTIAAGNEPSKPVHSSADERELAPEPGQDPVECSCTELPANRLSERMCLRVRRRAGLPEPPVPRRRAQSASPEGPRRTCL